MSRYDTRNQRAMPARVVWSEQRTGGGWEPLTDRVALVLGVVVACVVPTPALGASGELNVRSSPVTGLASFVTAADGGSIAVQAPAGRAVAGPMDFLMQHAYLFGVTAPEQQLVLEKAATDSLGHTHTTYRQVHQGVPVFSGVLKVHQNAARQFIAANGHFYTISPKLDTTPLLSPAEAEGLAATLVQQGWRIAGKEAVIEVPASPASALRSESELVIVDPGWYGDPPQGARLAYYVEVRDTVAGLAEAFFVEAHTGEVLDRWSLVESARAREIHNAKGTSNLPGDVARIESAPPTSIADVDAAYDYFGDVYDYYNRAFDRDSIDNHGMAMIATVNYYRPNFCPNAFWSPVLQQMVFCAGTITDDIVGHELTHGVTEHTANLIYQNQPGQLNESFSDIFGELIDLFNGNAAFAGDPGTGWLGHPTGPGQDTPNSSRTSECSVLDKAVQINAPADIAGLHSARRATFGPALTATGVTGDVVNADPVLACAPLTNGGAVNGHIALVDRSGAGGCLFTQKVWYAQSAGATGVIVVNNVPDPPVFMGGTASAITIPSVMISQANGALIRSKLAVGPVNVTMKDYPYVDGVRWLAGEDAVAFGGAIRDMWNPPCYGDPDRGNSPLQLCYEGDYGGVHSGSGIPNHAFAMMVDGQTFNGITVKGIGPIKAAAVWYRALTVYLTESSGFQDASEALAQAAADLIGSTPDDPRTAQPSSSAFTLNDALEVGKTLLAVEMDTPGRCGAMTRILRVDTPPVCPGRQTIFKEDFEHGTNGWTVYLFGAPTTPYHWVQRFLNLPQGRSSTVWFCEDRNTECVQGGPDESAVHYLASPPIVLPAKLIEPTLMFTHYINTEIGWDGGRVSIKVNSDNWGTIEASAIKHNAYNLQLYQDSTNPLGGKWGWTGSGGWGTTIIDLSGFVHGGDIFSVRFDFGKDQCYAPAGDPGWYVDDFEVFLCDCNSNGIADGTDIVAGTSVDCDYNGFPDNCEIQEDPSLDCDNNKAPDVCQADTDHDGFIDACDPCPQQAFVLPGACGCGVAATDGDSDGVPDCTDLCPQDANKSNPGICGCGVSDKDTDGDTIPDCNDKCPNERDEDADHDGFLNCNDLCPYDPNKTEPGQCGCGVVEIDTDGDGTPDCQDLCPSDPNKTTPGSCGCAVPDTDTDADGTPDCIDGTPRGAAQSLRIIGPDELLVGQRARYVAELLFADGRTEDISARVTWRVLDIVIVPGRNRLSAGDTISADGLLTVANRDYETTISLQALFDDGPVDLQGAKLVQILLEEQEGPEPIPSNGDGGIVEPGNDNGTPGPGNDNQGESPTPQPSRSSGRSPCGLGLFGAMLVSLLVAGFSKAARDRTSSPGGRCPGMVQGFQP